jgi:hypothetical protein
MPALCGLGQYPLQAKPAAQVRSSPTRDATIDPKSGFPPSHLASRYPADSWPGLARAVPGAAKVKLALAQG